MQHETALPTSDTAAHTGATALAPEQRAKRDRDGEPIRRQLFFGAEVVDPIMR